MTRHRIEYFDFAKGLLIFCVVWGHVCSYVSDSSYEFSALSRYIRLFQMPLFIAISGFFSKDIKTKTELFVKIKKDIMHIGIPLMSWSVLVVILDYVVSLIVSLPPRSFAASFLTYWFFQCLLVCSVSWHCISFVKNSNRVLGILLLISYTAVLVFFAPRLFTFNANFLWPFYILGVLVKKHFQFISDDRWTSFNLKWLMRLSLFLIVLFLGYHFKTEWTFYNESNSLLSEGSGLIAIFSKAGFVLYRYIVYVLSSLAALDFLWLMKKYILSGFKPLYDRILVGGGRNAIHICLSYANPTCWCIPYYCETYK